MTRIAELAESDRRELFRRSAASDSGPSDVVMIEKDYWVCWMLGLLFGDLDSREIIPGLVFKGGTSLSKVYSAINRFSEDIDLTIPRQLVGIEGSRDLSSGLSQTKKQQLLASMETECEAFVASEVRSRIETGLENALVADPGSRSRIAVDASDPQTLLFSYPAALEEGEYGVAGYVRPVIRLEFGLKNEVWPAHVAQVSPYADEIAPDTVSRTKSDVRVLDGERTFWEKVTILHLEAHREAPRPNAHRLSRHYADVASLADHPIGKQALNQPELLRAVANHKSEYYRTPWARYDEAADGRVKLLPSRATLDELERDYAQMEEMYFTQPPKFSDIVNRLGRLEAEIRALT